MRLKNGRRVGAAAAVLSAAALLAACGGGAQPGGGAGAGGASAWGIFGGSEDMFRATFEQWNTDNPDEQIAVEWFANDAYKEKIRTSVGAGNAPTLIYSWGGGTLADYVANDAVIDLTGKTGDLTDRVIPSVAASGQVDGTTYAVPNTETQPLILFYNQQVLDDAGVEVPTTYDELLAAVAPLESAGVTPIALAGQSVWPELMWIEYLTERIGGPEVFQAVVDGEPGAWSDPAILEATTKIRELVDAGAFGDSFGSVNADQAGDTALLQTGQAAFLLQGTWVQPGFLKSAPEFAASGDLGYTTFPAVEGGVGDPANIVGNPSNFWSISADASAEAQATASDFLANRTLDDAAVDELLALNLVPPVLGIEDTIAEQDDAEYLSFVYEMVSDAPNFQLSWDQALPAAQAQALLENLSQLFLGQIDPEQFSAAMDATL
ncbi:ABC transporter substrate-binding protein [Cellulomonas denverensis]|uniref:Extracellular solute-binding protein n=1 Tax=Cellulomonas denverensis TaxID=264297 RepID=A0A7X6QXW4_9CELL|nr:extracellular solute-binding protein [Cellulomonas denverensis]NKY21488.1 extracellular solute-binding protein [Cellulomonas denverensis]GIG27000.1 sugar ABC transporter substrate-binding protein [Cellulomonas denverensis]